MTAEQLMNLPGFDQSALSEVERALASISIKLNRRSRPQGNARVLGLKEYEDTGILATPIQDVFEHESRVRNAMLHARVRTLGQLVRTSETDLLMLKNFGRTSLAAVRDALAGYKLHLGMSEAQILAVCGREPKPPKAIKLPQQPTAPAPRPARPIPDAGVLTISVEGAFDSETRARNSLIAARITTLGVLARQRDWDLLRLKGFGRTSLAVVEQVLAKHGLRLGMSDEYLQAMSASLQGINAEHLQLQAPTLLESGKHAKHEMPTGHILQVANKFLDEIDERDRRLVAFFFYGSHKNTLETTGKRFKLTRERVRQLLARSCQRLARVFLRSGISEAATALRTKGGCCLPKDEQVRFLCVSPDEIRREARFINAASKYLSPDDTVCFDLDYQVWHIGRETIEEKLGRLKAKLPILATQGEVGQQISKFLRLKDSGNPVVEELATIFVAREMLTVPGTQFLTHKKASKQELAEEILKRLFPAGAHFSKIAAVTNGFGPAKRLEPRNAHAALTLNSSVVLWGRGEFRHKDNVRINEPLLLELLEKIDSMFLPQVSTVSAHAVFERYKSLAVQAGLPNPMALYATLEWRYPKRYLYRHYPDIESLKATRRPKVRRVEELEAILADSDGPLSVDQIKERMGSHRRLKDHHVVQRLPESRCVLLYDAGCYVHETVLGITSNAKAEIQRKTREYLNRGVGYATTKQIRLALELPSLKLPWTLRLLGSILEQDPELSRIYNVAAFGKYDSWDSLLGQIVRDSIGDRPGVTLDELNESLIAREFITMPLTAASVAKFTQVTITDGYIRVRS